MNGKVDLWDLTTDSYSIGFFNPLFYGKTANSVEEIPLDRIPDLKGKRITNALYQERESLILEIEDAGVLLLSVKLEDFIHDEAAEVKFPSGEIVIFDQDK